MPKPLFEIKIKTGWIKLDNILERVQNAINERTPLASDTVDLDERDDGMQICVKDSSGGSSSEESGAGASGAAGTPVAIYGSTNGSPALFHLFQSGPATAP